MSEDADIFMFESYTRLNAYVSSKHVQPMFNAKLTLFRTRCSHKYTAQFWKNEQNPPLNEYD